MLDQVLMCYHAYLLGHFAGLNYPLEFFDNEGPNPHCVVLEHRSVD